MLRQHTFVGMADETLALLQHSTRLYILNVANLSKDMFYQQVCLLVCLQQGLALSADCAFCCRCEPVVVRCMVSEDSCYCLVAGAHVAVRLQDNEHTKLYLGQHVISVLAYDHQLLV